MSIPYCRQSVCHHTWGILSHWYRTIPVVTNLSTLSACLKAITELASMAKFLALDS